MSAVAERYARAASSSYLKLTRWFEPGGDLEVLMAAGLLQDSLGVGLLRLRAEFDSIRTRPGARNMLPRLKSAGSVRTRMLALVLDRGAPLVTADAALEIVAKLLDQWCDPSCPTCTGRGVMGAYGEPQTICRPPKEGGCGGSKRRTLFWPADQQRFADEIAAEMESKVDSAERRIGRLLKD